MKNNYTYEQLVEKIVRARVMIESKKGRRVGHTMNCMLDMDPDYYGPCTCGVSKANEAAAAAFDDVLETLEL